MARSYLSFAALVDIIGEADALTLCKQYGGMAVYISKTPERCALNGIIGGCAVESLCAELGGEEYMLARGPLHRPPIKEVIATLLEAGASLREAAKECGCSTRYVHYVRRDIGLTPPRPASKPKKQKILEVLRANPENLSVREIAEKFECSRDYIYGLRSEYQIARIEATQKARSEANRNA
jgi:transposase-like protein